MRSKASLQHYEGHGGHRFVSFPDLRARFGIRYSRMHIDRLEKAGKFPKRVQLGPNSVVWLEDEIVARQAKLIAARDQSAAA
jgi:prophage regulatory protein